MTDQMCSLADIFESMILCKGENLTPCFEAPIFLQTYNQTRHDHEITLEKQTIIELSSDEQDAAVIPQILYHVSFPLNYFGKMPVFYLLPNFNCKSPKILFSRLLLTHQRTAVVFIVDLKGNHCSQCTAIAAA